MDKSQRRSAPRPQSLCLEPLESRCLLAALPALPIAMGPVLPAETIILEHWKIAPPHSNDGQAFSAQQRLGADVPSWRASGGWASAFVSDPAAGAVTELLILMPDVHSQSDAPALGHDAAALWGDATMWPAVTDATPSIETAVSSGFMDPVVTSARAARSPVSVVAGESQSSEGRELSLRSSLAGAGPQPELETHARSVAPAAAVTALASSFATLGRSLQTPPVAIPSSPLLRAIAGTEAVGPNAALPASRTIWGPAELSDRLAAVATALPEDVIAAAVEEQAGPPAPSAATLGAIPPEQAAVPIAGLLPVDVAALARNADKFFARLTKLGTDWVDPRLAFEVAMWSAALAAGVYEVARLRSRKIACPALADGDEISGFVMAPDGDGE